MSFHKTTVEIDTDELARAEIALGTSGIKETVNRALAEVNRRDALGKAARYVEGGGLHVPDERTLAAWRAPRS
jgi:Arc/MetJ family transcription regulator